MTKIVCAMGVDGGDYSLSTIDVDDPDAIAILGTLVDNTRFVTGVVRAQGDYAYVAANGYFSVVDLTDTSSPSVVGDISMGLPAATPNGMSAPTDISGTLVVAVTYPEQLVIVDISTPGSPSIADTLDFENGVDTYEDCRGATILGTNCFVGAVLAASGDAHLVTVDVSDPSNISISGSGDLGASGDMYAVANKTDYVLAMGQGGDSDEIIYWDVSTPASPTVADSLNPGGIGNDGRLNGADQAVVLANGELNIVDVSTPASISSEGTIVFPVTPEGIALDGNTIVFALGFGPPGLIAPYDYSNPASIDDLTPLVDAVLGGGWRARLSDVVEPTEAGGDLAFNAAAQQAQKLLLL